MPIQINNTNVIDDSRNFSAAGIATISSVTINGSTSTVNVGTGITLSGSTGNISIAGSISAVGLNVPIQVTSFNPPIGSSIANTANIVINFNQTVGFGTTGFIEIKRGSTTGVLVERVGIGSTRVTLDNGGRRLTIDPTATLPVDTIFPIMSNGFVVANGNNFAGINTVGAATTYSFVSSPALGDSFGGGNLICQSGGVRWVAASSSTEVSRSWYCRGDANTTAQSISGCTGWFVPSCTQLYNPGYVCRTYWNPCTTFTVGLYWSNTEKDTNNAYIVRFDLDAPGSFGDKTNLRFVRSFRCVTY